MFKISCCDYICCNNRADSKNLYIIEKSSHSDRVAQLYSRIAWLYDPFTDHEQAHHIKAIQMADLSGNELVLEVACGTGRATFEIAKKLLNGKLFAIDLTWQMLKRAKRKIYMAGLSEKVVFAIADAKELPFSTQTFDVIYNAYMFDLIDLSDFSLILSEFKRVLKPGGKLILVNMSKNNQNKTFYEFLYESGLLQFSSGGCRPVFLKPFVEAEGFEKIQRVYRKNRSYFPLNLLVGTEIIVGYKPES